MKKIFSAALILGLSLSLTACGESLEKPTEPTQAPPVWAVAPESRPTEATEATVPPTAATEPAETEPPLVTLPNVETEPAETTLPAETEVPEETRIPLNMEMEEKFQPASGTLYAKQHVNVRDQANTDSVVLEKLSQGDAVQRVGTSTDGWTAIVQGERVCYVSSEYLVDQPVEPPKDVNKIEDVPMDDEVYTNHRVNLREGPFMDRSILASIPESTELHRIGSTNTGWFKVEYKDLVGYVSDMYVVPKYYDSKEHPSETAVEETVHTTREVNLRKGPGTDNEILGRIPEGTEVTRIATTSNEWSKVLYNGQEGYISSKYVEAGSAPKSEG